MLNSCYNCNHSKNISYEVVGEYELVKCSDCGLIYISSFPDDLFSFIDEAKSEKTDEVEFWSVPEFLTKYKDIFNKYYDQRLVRLAENGFKNNSEVLDVGIGYGDWANKLVSKGHSVSGIDVSMKVVDFCVKEYSLDAKFESFENYVNKDETFDLITMFDVLEHFQNPPEALTKAHNLLKDDGLIYIQVPNVLGFKIPMNHGYGLPYHLWQFDIYQLRKLLKKQGFEVLNYWTGIQGIIGYHDRGEVNFLTNLKWSLANYFKIGNRIQVLARKS